MKQCILTGGTKNLNTSMTVRLDDGSVVECWICDEVADEATPRRVKEAYIEKHSGEIAKKQEIDALIAKAKELGLEIAVPGAEKIELPKTEPVTQPVTQPRLEDVKKGSIVVDSGEADHMSFDPKVQTTVDPFGGGSIGGVEGKYEVTSGDKPSESLREGEVAEVSIVEGRQGMPLRLPTKRVGKMGTTRISVKQTFTDRDLQKRAKDYQHASETGNVHSFANGYDFRVVECPLCKGGLIRGKTCPKCDGTGQIEIATGANGS